MYNIELKINKSVEITFVETILKTRKLVDIEWWELIGFGENSEYESDLLLYSIVGIDILIYCCQMHLGMRSRDSICFSYNMFLLYIYYTFYFTFHVLPCVRNNLWNCLENYISKIRNPPRNFLLGNWTLGNWEHGKLKVMKKFKMA